MPHSTRPTSPDPILPSERLRILVVDDSEVPRFLLSKILEKMGHEVVDFADGASALAEMAREPCDLAILDVMMPEMDGPATAAAIRASGEPWANIPLLAATASPLPLIEARCRAAGIGEIMTKPVSFGQVKQALEPFLHHSASSGASWPGSALPCPAA